MRLKLNKYLKIKKTEKDDAGFYTCVAENDCGRNTYTIQLLVRSKLTLLWLALTLSLSLSRTIGLGLTTS